MTTNSISPHLVLQAVFNMRCQCLSPMVLYPAHLLFKHCMNTFYFAGSGDSSNGAFVWYVILHTARWTLLLRTNPNSRTKFHWAVTRRECVHCGNTRRTRRETRDCPSHNKWYSKEEAVLQSSILWARASDCKLCIAIQAGRSILTCHNLSQTFSL